VSQLPPTTLLRTGAVARILGVARRTVTVWLRDPPIGFPAPKRINNRSYLVLSDVMAWLAGRESANAS
jgi:predicted DNA-binding transcriptional regulator AlpA